MVTYGEICTAALLTALGLIALYFLRKAPWRRRRLASILNIPQVFRERPAPRRNKVVIRSQPTTQPFASTRPGRTRASKTVIIRELSQNSVLRIEGTVEGHCCLCGDVAGPQQSLRFGLAKKCPCGRVYHVRCIRWAQSIRRGRCRCGRDLAIGM